MEAKQRGRVRWIALGTVLGVVAVWGGSGVAGAAPTAPTTITTCTKASNGATKVIAASAVAKCTKNGKGVAKTWDGSIATLVAELAAAKAPACDLTAIVGFDSFLLGYWTDQTNPAFTSAVSALSIRCFAPAPPPVTPTTTITTCTKTNGKTKVIAPATVAKCTKKGKGVAKTWDGSSAGPLNAQLALARAESCNLRDSVIFDPILNQYFQDEGLFAVVLAHNDRCFAP